MIGSRPTIAFRLPAADVELVLQKHQGFATPYGRGLWASMWMDKAVDWKVIQRLLESSYEMVANKRMRSARAAR
jgi:hypothetical protein